MLKRNISNKNSKRKEKPQNNMFENPQYEDGKFAKIVTKSADNRYEAKVKK